MPNQQDQLAEVRTRLAEIRTGDIAHASELGTEDVFDEAQRIKDDTVDYVDGVLERIDDAVVERLPPGALAQYASYVQEFVRSVGQAASTADRFARQPPPRPKLSQERARLTDELQEAATKVAADLHPLMLDIDIARLQQSTDPESLAREVAGVEELRDEAVRFVGEIEKLHDTVQQLQVRKTVEEAKANFNQLRSAHKHREKAWFVTAVCLSLTLLGSVVFVLATDIPDSVDVSAVVMSVFRRVLAISTTGVFLRIALRRYDLERHLRIVYDHRATVLEQYRDMEPSLGDPTDRTARDQFRLAIARYLFTDPRTGYVEPAHGDLNINPVLAALEGGATTPPLK